MKPDQAVSRPGGRAWPRLSLILFSTAMLLDPSAALADDNLKDIIENVEANEKLYENIEVIAKRSYRLGSMKSAVLPSTMLSSGSDDRVVLQRGMIYFKADALGKTIKDEEANFKSLQGYDGEVTRIFEQEAMGNVRHERTVDKRIFSLLPHTALFLVQSGGLAFPLSTYLRGTEAVKAHRSYRDKNLTVQFVGAEDVGGLRCLKLKCVLWVDSWTAPVPDDNYQLIWLAPDRNYIPVKMEWYLGRMGRFPEHVGEVNAWREVKTGVWFPTKVTYETFDASLFTPRVGPPPANHWETVFEKINLEPDYPIELFRDIKFPNGIPVYEVKDGKVVRSWIQGGIIPKASRGWSFWRLGLPALSLMTGLTLVVAWTRSKSSRSGCSKTPSSHEEPRS